MKCVVIDDEPFALDLIKDYILRTPFLELTAEFNNPFKALDFINREKVDLLFLDINMPELSGIQLIKSLHNPPLVIFTTAYSEFAVESYNYNAVDYLLKPIPYERFLKAVNKASAIKQPGVTKATPPAKSEKPDERACFFIKSGHQQVKIFIDEILYIEAAGNYMSFVTAEKKIMSLLSMKEAMDLLPEGRFVRIHKSFVVAIDKIGAIDRHEVTVAEKKIPIGVTYREHFHRVMGMS